MDGVILTSVLILVIIVTVEAYCLFSDRSLKRKNTGFVFLIPVFDNDILLKQRLDEIENYIRTTDFDVSDRILVVNFSNEKQQLFLINEFCLHNNIKEIVQYSELEKKLCEMFAIETKK